jgi:hypothetical protein
MVKSPASKGPFVITAPEVMVKPISKQEIRKYLSRVEVELTD